MCGRWSGVGAFGEELQDVTLLLGERFDRGVMGRVAGKRNKLPGDIEHTVELLLVPVALIDVAGQPNEEPASRPLVVEDNG